MKKYIAGAILSVGILVSPTLTHAAGLTTGQAYSLISVVQSAPGVPASAFVNLITAFSNITVNQATSLIVVVQSAPGASASTFVDLLISFTADTPASQAVTPQTTQSATESTTSSSSAASAAPSLTLTASPSTITAGQSATISWNSNSDSYCEVFGGKADNNGSLSTNALYSTTQYSVTCHGLNGTSVTKSVTVAVNPATVATPTLNYTANPTTITAGQSAVLSWFATNAYYCSDGGKADISGSISTGALYATKTFTMTCPGAGGSVSKSVTVTVQPSLELSVSPLTVTAGQSATLSWSSSATGYCEVFGGKADNNGSLSTNALYSTTQYTVTCYNTDGTSVKKSVSASVN